MSQNPIMLPTQGTISGTQLVTLINQSLDTLLTLNAGSSQPSSPAEAYQLWLDTSTAPPVLRINDGTQWVALGALDVAGHLWTPPVGGGKATLASAATTDLGSVPQAAIQITGTVTITALGASAKQGQLKFVDFASALTLAHNAASLILPGGANITTAADDTAIFEYLGAGNWRCLAYQRASGRPVVPTTDATTIQGRAVSSTAPVDGQVLQWSAANNDWEPKAQTVPSPIKAWVNFDGTTGAIRASFNVSSVTRTGTGSYTINFAAAMANANYVVSGTISDPAGDGPMTIQSGQSVNSVTVNARTFSNALWDPSFVMVSIISN